MNPKVINYVYYLVPFPFLNEIQEHENMPKIFTYPVFDINTENSVKDKELNKE